MIFTVSIVLLFYCQTIAAGILDGPRQCTDHESYICPHIHKLSERPLLQGGIDDTSVVASIKKNIKKSTFSFSSYLIYV